VSVGSPVVGGAGKTPTAAWIAARLRARGHRVALATRDHGGRRDRGVRVLSDGHAVIGDPVGSGDEALLLCAHAPGVPVLVARDRVRAARVAIAAFDARVLVLDDGLAHHRLARDVEVITLDAASGLGNGAVLPRGPLREPLPRIRGPRALGVVDGALDPADERRVTRWLPDAERYAARRRAVSVRPLGGGAAAPPASLSGVEVGVRAGIARPEAFERTVEALGARIVARRARPDHHRYGRADLAGLGDGARVWLTTEKDAVKILPSWCGGLDLRVLRIALEVEHETRLLDWLEGCIEACPYPVRPPVVAVPRAAAR
jgi:tetraacyldisaccharide 4'-kinase